MLQKRGKAVNCPKCKLGGVMRVKREGFLENAVLARCGYYPWLCAECKRRVMLRVREDVGRGMLQPNCEPRRAF
jgi:ssDNA-binding Zn-finger/Zn-ribbon topoisomerase 1